MRSAYVIAATPPPAATRGLAIGADLLWLGIGRRARQPSVAYSLPPAPISRRLAFAAIMSQRHHTRRVLPSEHWANMEGKGRMGSARRRQAGDSLQSRHRGTGWHC